MDNDPGIIYGVRFPIGTNRFLYNSHEIAAHRTWPVLKQRIDNVRITVLQQQVSSLEGELCSLLNDHNKRLTKLKKALRRYPEI